ncbi:hypothetical protein LTR56_022630 [Elasticomyces elasticus]|nr:hypothetical protein LTR56_022630 [Elasticomyces elasticus]KAK3628403.1 hypothetical protein LTR22_022364 [Elasticomyces elasticus]KAK4905773.1 hypothetical protein LTR49_024979 [Elasticomyces elasticus]KAK5743235.1 hypothetical protein LTS12_023923 [Elasticomyces elasticus]
MPVGLPEEVLQHIFAYLHEIADLRCLDQGKDAQLKRSTLASISLASSSYHRIVRPELYHTLIVEDDARIARPLHFLRTLLEHPNTGRLVREIHSGGWSVKAHRKDKRCVTGVESTSTILLDAAARAGIPALSRENVEMTLWIPAAEASIAMMLPFIPMLRLLTINARLRVDLNPVMTALRHVQLPQLSEVRTVSEGGESALDRLLDVLQLPALRTFRARKVSCAIHSTDALANIKVPLGLEHVFLEDSNADEIGIGRLLAAAPGLKTLSVYWESQDGLLVHSGSLGQALCARGKNLETVRLGSVDPDEKTLYPVSGTQLGDLREMASLRHLALPYAVLCSESQSWLVFQIALEDAGGWFERSHDYLVRVLPHSLRSLDIEHAKWSTELAEALGSVQHEGVLVRNPLDLQLLELMTDGRYVDLSLITVHRVDNFTCLQEAELMGWVEEPGQGRFTLRKSSAETF